MIRGKYLRERKALHFRRRVKFILILTIVIIICKILLDSFSLFESQASSSADIDIAFYVVDDSYETEYINIGDIQPDDEETEDEKENVKEYYFTISNYITEDDVTYIAETDIEYTLTIRATTNLPLEYSLYVGVDSSNEKAVNSASDAIVQDDDNTYFKKIYEYEGSFTKLDPTSTVYELVITYPDDEEYKDAEYQDIIECIEIAIDSHQK